jgi:hypothetical protein
MAFSTATITHQFTDADGSDSVGWVVFTLTEDMTNNGVTIAKETVIESALVDGALSQEGVTSNLDTGTTPTVPQPQWRVDIRLQGADVQTFFITVPTGGGTIDLFTLIPGEEQVG